ncbi:hypothetical protein [Bartonella ancashensis]|uniref:Putative prophage protein n=1 Tax=Bartonella ancashensis TaxID=1318743 RepID=A0A0M4LJE8_9HYPH|nr:hypothetical protein [Bartonella ancashensis]ALE03427.1 putative prophage protein [Bartonella ancashensis]ALE03493.1 putative prophage protein [Bartonella ancashensis]
MGHKVLKILDEKATKEELSTMFQLLSGALKHQSTADAKATAAAYLLSLDGISHWALKTATRDIMRGKAEGLSRTFMPSAPELYAYCDKLERDIRGCVEYVFKALEKPEAVS